MALIRIIIFNMLFILVLNCIDLLILLKQLFQCTSITQATKVETLPITHTLILILISILILVIYLMMSLNQGTVYQRCTSDHSANEEQWCATSVARDGSVIIGEKLGEWKRWLVKPEME